MSQQERKRRIFEIDYQLDWEYGVEISQIRKDIDALERLGATHVDVGIEDSWGDRFVKFSPISERMETEEELKLRVAAEKEREDRLRNIEIEQLRKLKEKYES